MRIAADWHIHSHHSHDAAALTFADMIRGTRAHGIREFGVTDHFHTPCNLPEMGASRREFLDSTSDRPFHFGVEASCVSQWELDEIATGKHGTPVTGLRVGGPVSAAPALGLTAQDIEKLGIEYVIGSSHWPLYVPETVWDQIREHHRQNLFLAAHPLVDIVGHPWYWSGNWKAAGKDPAGVPWYGEFHNIPRSMHREFAAAAKENGTAVEINLRSILLRDFGMKRYKQDYLDYLAFLGSEGVTFAVGSDCHSAHYDIDIERTSAMLETLDLRDQDTWRLPPRKDSIGDRQ